MEIYKVNKITEADYGCEDTGREDPTALLFLASENDGTEKRVELSERIISKRGIDEGKKVCFAGNGELLKYIRVVAAVIREKNKVFATARGYGEYKGWWEFPGGKIETGETPEQALVREIREELTAEISVKDYIKTLEYDYPDFHLSMDCFWSEVVGGELVLKEAEAARWLSKDELLSVKWLPADMELIDIIRRELDE